MSYIDELVDRCGFKYQDALMRYMNREDVLELFFKKFLDDPSYAGIAEAFDNADREALRHASHALKGVAANLSMENLRAASEKLQKMAENPEAEDLSDIYAEVTDAYNACTQIIRAHFGE